MPLDSHSNESAVSPRQTPIRFSDATIAVLACPAGKKDILAFDAEERGFGVRVTKDGKRVFLFQYRVGPVLRRHRIGVWGQGGLTTTKARKIAEKLRGQVHEGQDPVADKRAIHLANAAAKAAELAQAESDAFTLTKLVDAWEAKGLINKRASYARDATARLRNYLKPLADKPASSITRADAIRAIDRVETERGTISARRLMAYARACYGWAIKRDLLEANPFKGIAPPGQENTRERVLTQEEVQAIWGAAGALDPIPAAFIRILLLTLQRLNEVAGMRWDELAEDLSTWTIPATRAKNGKTHLIHLPVAARNILRPLPRMAGNPLVFTGRRGGGTSGFSRKKAALEEAIQKERVEAGVTPERLPDWRFHDFRRTGVTVLANMGTPPHVADKLLNHITGSIQGVAAVYQRAEFLAERKAALEAWAEFVAGKT